MKQKIIISADSTCDLPQDFIKENHILITPLHIVLGGDTYEDLVNITPDDIYTYFDKTGLLPKTSAVNIQEYIDTFKPVVEQGCEIVHLNIGHALSTCYQHCKLAAKELGVKIHVVDSCNLSMGSGLLVMEAVDMMKQGLTAQEIAENLHNMTSKV
ncbi:MAG: DegV family protein, partial [Clostridia bacterium]|nr:DegV family protein [Clostridia bacterium]